MGTPAIGRTPPPHDQFDQPPDPHEADPNTPPPTGRVHYIPGMPFTATQPHVGRMATTRRGTGTCCTCTGRVYTDGGGMLRHTLNRSPFCDWPAPTGPATPPC